MGSEGQNQDLGDPDHKTRKMTEQETGDTRDTRPATDSTDSPQWCCGGLAVLVILGKILECVCCVMCTALSGLHICLYNSLTKRPLFRPYCQE